MRACLFGQSGQKLLGQSAPRSHGQRSEAGSFNDSRGSAKEGREGWTRVKVREGGEKTEGRDGGELR